jgi:hypothetical protein
MTIYTIHYRYAGKDHQAAFPARSARWARLLGPLQLMKGAEVLRVEPAK